MRLRTIGVCAVLLAASISGFAGTGSAQQKIAIKIGWVTPDSPEDPYAKARMLQGRGGAHPKGASRCSYFPIISLATRSRCSRASGSGRSTRR